MHKGDHSKCNKIEVFFLPSGFSLSFDRPLSKGIGVNGVLLVRNIAVINDA